MWGREWRTPARDTLSVFTITTKGKSRALILLEDNIFAHSFPEPAEIVTVWHNFWKKTSSGSSPGEPGRLQGRPVGVCGGLGEAPEALRDAILGEKVVFGKCARRRGARGPARGPGRPVAAPCYSGAVRDVARRLRNVLRGKGAVQKIQKFRRMRQFFAVS